LLDTTIYIVRHGQTEWNLEGRFQGRLDSPLTNAGVEQAKQLAQRLQNISFDSIYSSSSNRAFSTALHLRKDRAIEVNKSDHLMEMDFATWEGRKWSEIQDLYPKELLLILLVSHSITIKVLINYLRGANLKYLWEGPDILWASLYEICFTDDKTKIFFEGEEILPLQY
jgi:probable phosphoglycerate mutase